MALPPAAVSLQEEAHSARWLSLKVQLATLRNRGMGVLVRKPVDAGEVVVQVRDDRERPLLSVAASVYARAHHVPKPSWMYTPVNMLS